MRRAFLVSGAVAFLVLTALACGDETIPLATIPATDAGVPPPPPSRCVDSTDCPANAFCAKASCGDPAGTCQIAQVVCTDPEQPVCGCDHVTYFNDCLRQSNGVPAAMPGQCFDTALRCGGFQGNTCPDGAVCSLLQRHDPCAHDVPGTCWVLPANCPISPGTDLWDSCDNGPQCVDTCTAIKSGAPYHRAGLCP